MFLLPAAVHEDERINLAHVRFVRAQPAESFWRFDHGAADQI